MGVHERWRCFTVTRGWHVNPVHPAATKAWPIRSLRTQAAATCPTVERPDELSSVGVACLTPKPATGEHVAKRDSSGHVIVAAEASMLPTAIADTDAQKTRWRDKFEALRLRGCCSAARSSRNCHLTPTRRLQ